MSSTDRRYIRPGSYVYTKGQCSNGILPKRKAICASMVSRSRRRLPYFWIRMLSTVRTNCIRVLNCVFGAWGCRWTVEC